MTETEPIEPSECKAIAPSFTSERIPSVLENKCLVSHTGRDGFGHQLLGKLSWIIFAEIHKTKFIYVHIPFATYEHSNVSTLLTDEFINFEGLFPTERDFEQRGHVLKRKMMETNDELKLLNGTCDNRTLYWSDGTYNTIFKTAANYDRVRAIIEHSPIFHRIRRAYHSSPKPPLEFFCSNRPNVVIHVRGGDAQWRPGAFTKGRSALAFYTKGVDFYNEYFLARDGLLPFYVIESDIPTTPIIHDLLETFKGNIVLSSADENNFFGSFHRMVMADGFILVSSSFSAAVALYRKPDVPMVGPPNGPLKLMKMWTIL